MPEPWANDHFLVPVLRRAPAFLDVGVNKLEPIGRVLVRKRTTAPPVLSAAAAATHQNAGGARNVNVRRSISHRISRVAATTFRRKLSEGHLEDEGDPAQQHRIHMDFQIRKAVHDDASDANNSWRASNVSDSWTSNLDAPATVIVDHAVRLEESNTPTTTVTVMSMPKSSSNASPQPESLAPSDVPIPVLLQQGIAMTKVSAKSQKSYLFKLDADQGQIIWESKKLKIIPIENIKELRSGSDARYYRQQFQLAREYEDRWITIIYMLDGQYKMLHLIAPSLDSFRLWDITLRKLYAIRRELMTGIGNEEIRQAVWIKQCWKSTGEQTDHRLSFDQVEKLCRRLNINPSQEDLMRLFQNADSQNRRYLDFTDFQTFVKLLKARPDIEILYRKLSSMKDGKLTLSVFECFMHETQKSGLTRHELETLFVRYSTKTSDSRSLPSTPDISSLAMSLDGFTAFLLSSDNSAFVGQNTNVYQPMTYPLSDYFISSSHNTYLVGHQLVGNSTIEGYIRALLHSCRSVELDIYDGEREPMVFHGKTLTSKVSAREVCEAIMKYAFVTSPYPIIISAEIHCSVSQQEMLATIMHEAFGEALVSAPMEGKPLSGPLPSPEDLKGRVLLKAKNLYVSENEPINERDISIDTESSSTDTSTSDSDAVHELREEFRKVALREAETIKGDSITAAPSRRDAWLSVAPTKTTELKDEFRKARSVFNRVRGRRSSPERSTITAVIEPSARLDSKPEHKARMSPALVALLVYTVGIKCRGINKKENYAPVHMFSLSERTINKIVKQGPGDLIKHNKTHLVRIYPKGTRVSSTNYLPHRYWATGAQLVAINWQTFDLGYMINHAMFQRNGRSGYVLKPETLRKTEDPRKSDKEHLHAHTQHYLEVTVISAQQLPRPKDAMGREIMDKPVDPYVEVSILTPDWSYPSPSSSAHPPSSAGTPSTAHSSSTSAHSQHPHRTSVTTTTTTTTTTTARTSSVKNNGFNPVWQETLTLPFSCVGHMRDLVFVRFAVQRDGESDGEPIAVYCISLGSLAMGYRHLPLHDSQLSQYLFSTLFVRCSVRDV